MFLLLEDIYSVTITLIGSDFGVPQGTVVRYVAHDVVGGSETHGIDVTNVEGSIGIQLPFTAAYLEFSIGKIYLQWFELLKIFFLIGGSDGFDPVYFQPFEYIYNGTSIYDGLTIDIPVKTLKNVIVSVKECWTGQVLNVPAFVSFPSHSPKTSSWYDSELMPNRSCSYTDEQVFSISGPKFDIISF